MRRRQTVLLVFLAVRVVLLHLFLHVLPHLEALDDLVGLPLSPHEIIFLPALEVTH